MRPIPRGWFIVSKIAEKSTNKQKPQQPVASKDYLLTPLLNYCPPCFCKKKIWTQQELTIFDKYCNFETINNTLIRLREEWQEDEEEKKRMKRRILVLVLASEYNVIFFCIEKKIKYNLFDTHKLIMHTATE